RVPPAADVLGVIEDLRDRLTPRFGVAPQLCLHDDELAVLGDEEIVDRARFRGHLAPQRAEGWLHSLIDLFDRQQAGGRIQNQLKPSLVKFAFALERHTAERLTT